MDAKLNQSDLISLMAKGNNISVAKAELFTKNFFDLIIEGLEQDGIVKINGLGTFRITDVASRGSVNVNTGEKIEIKGHRKLTFTPADSLKECVNQPFAMFEPVEVDETYQPDAEGADVETDDVAEENIVTQAYVHGSEPSGVVEEAVSSQPQEVQTVTEEVVVESEKQDELLHAEQNEEKDAVVEADEPVVVQERPAEPVMVRVPKKKEASGQKPLTTGKKRGKWSIVLSVIMGFIVGIVIINILGREQQTDADNKVQDTPSGTNEVVVVAEPEDAPVIVKEVADEIVEPAETIAVTDEVAPTEENTVVAIQSEESIDNTPVVAELMRQDAPYKFVIVNELASTNLKDITLADTTLYIADVDLARHIVAPDETLTKIARLYYGDKKLWPYIVKYNGMANPNGLANGMEIAIPRLLPKR